MFYYSNYLLQFSFPCFVQYHLIFDPVINTLRPRQNGRHFADDIFKRIFLNENVWIPIKISLKFVHKGPIINIPALVQIMAWRRSGDKPLSEPMMVSLPTHICVTRPQWVNGLCCRKQLLVYVCQCSFSYIFHGHLSCTCTITQLIDDERLHISKTFVAFQK